AERRRRASARSPPSRDRSPARTGFGAPRGSRVSPSPPTTSCRSARSTGAWRSSAGSSSARCATTSVRTRPARGCCARSTASSSAEAALLLQRGAALVELLGDLVERIERALGADRELAELLADVLGRLVERVAPVRDLIGHRRARAARDVAQPGNRIIDARAHVAGRLLTGCPQLIDRLLQLVPDAAT